jgi:hypothetical protein
MNFSRIPDAVKKKVKLIFNHYIQFNSFYFIFIYMFDEFFFQQSHPESSLSSLPSNERIIETINRVREIVMLSRAVKIQRFF